ncbi:hypothetical protein [Flavicella sp.]|uniref:hypothetical protein n=1 Tax=Flavicella sp. TaxID=2957742 RepID=UPI00301834E3
MKNLLYTLSILFIVSCSQDESTETNQINEAPDIPSLLNPSNNQLCTSDNLDFEWASSTDYEGDEVNYYYQVSTDNMFNAIVKSGTIIGTLKNLQLEKETAYYWRVQAIDSKGNKSDFSEIWNLYTESIGLENNLPFMPELVAPKMEASLDSDRIILEWNCSDIDNDNLVYNLYIGKTENPILVLTNISDTSTEITIDSNSNYYWKVEAIDTNDGKTIGQLWSFTTSF